MHEKRPVWRYLGLYVVGPLREYLVISLGRFFSFFFFSSGTMDIRPAFTGVESAKSRSRFGQKREGLRTADCRRPGRMTPEPLREPSRSPIMETRHNAQVKVRGPSASYILATFFICFQLLLPITFHVLSTFLYHFQFLVSFLGVLYPAYLFSHVGFVT